jgi:hypothetical protein
MNELNWLHRKAKDLIIPALLIVPQYAWRKFPGCYYHPQSGEIEFRGHFTPLSNGLIIASEITDWCPGGFASTLAHEWRHHWQWFNMTRGKGATWDPTLPYDKAIVKFFESKIELDALLFSHAVAPCEETRIWKSLVEKETT